MKSLRDQSVHTWLVLNKAQHAIGSRLSRQLAAMNLGETDFRVLEILRHKGPMPVNGIGPKVYLNPGSISVAVDRLYERKLVTRIESESDRRIRIVSLTSAGERIIDEAFACHADLIEELFKPLSREEREMLASMLKRLGKAVTEDSAQEAK